MKTDYIKLIVSILVCQGAGWLGSIFTRPSVKSEWFSKLEKPAFQPPDWLFGPVWITLFLLMGISLYLIWDIRDPEAKIMIPIGIFGFQLLLNIGWSFLFFHLKNPFWAFLEIILLWIAILITMIGFYQIKKSAGLLLVPYLLWVSFASILNYFLWQLNKG